MTVPTTGHPSIEGTAESFFGNLEFVQDVLLIVQACRQELLPRSVRRLRDGDRSSTIRPGSVFVWKSNEAGMRRWTDGKSWSPSRSHGSFLIYRECLPKDQLAAISTAKADTATSSQPAPLLDTAHQPITSPRQATVTDLGNGLQIKHGHRGDYCPLPNGLVKRTISVPVAVDGATYNVVNYVHFDDASNAMLPTPSTDPWLREHGITTEKMPWTLYPSIVNSILLNKTTGTSAAGACGRRESSTGSSLSTTVAPQLESSRPLAQASSMRRPSESSYNMQQGHTHQPAGAIDGLHARRQDGGHARQTTPWPMATYDLPQHAPDSTAAIAPSVQTFPSHQYHNPSFLPSWSYPNTAHAHMPGHSNFASRIPSPPLYAPSTSPLLMSSSAPNLSPISLPSRQRAFTGSPTSTRVMRETWASAHRPAPYPSPRGSCPVSPIRSRDAMACELEPAPILAPIASTRAYPPSTRGLLEGGRRMGDHGRTGMPLGNGPEPIYVEPGWAATSASSGYCVGSGRPLSDGSVGGAFRPFPPPV